MSKQKPVNLEASVRQRLLTLSRIRNEDFDYILRRYALERLLYRLAKSEYADKFVLKGAVLFTAWSKSIHRPTRDLDLLGYGDTSEDRVRDVFSKICQVIVEADGLKFDVSSIQIAEIREEQEYQGQRVKLTAKLGTIRIPVQVDIGFGDVVTPAVENIDYPTLLDFPAPRISAYPRETVIAEKLQAIVSLGMFNSRMKDFYDLWIISKQFSFQGDVLIEAIRATFKRRSTQIPGTTPVAFTEEFATDVDKSTQWRAFLRRSNLGEKETELQQVIDELKDFLILPLTGAASGDICNQKWIDGGPWH